MKRIKEIMDFAISFLEENDIPQSKTIASLIISDVCKIKRNEIFLYQDKVVSSDEIKRINKYLNAVLKRKPLSWVLKSHNFNGVELYIEDGVFVPRPETEELASMVLEKSFGIKNPIILDFCAGSGAIGIYIALKNKNSKVFAVDKSKKAFEVMLRNKEDLGLDNFFAFRSNRIDIFDFKFDIVVSNPPYVPRSMYYMLDEVVRKEPKSAIISGEDGLNMVRYILRNIDILKNGGFLFLEVGEYYSDKLREILSIYFKNFEILKDINKKDRFVFAIKN
jgi:release factor glutamine methyltransferase